MATQSRLGLLPRELRLDIFARALTHEKDLRRPSATDKAASKATIDLSLLITCKAFSFEAIEVLYTSNAFQLREVDFDLFTNNLQTQKMRFAKLIDTKPLDIYNQESADSVAAIAAVGRLARHCSNLRSVIIPYTLVTKPCPDRKQTLSTATAGLGLKVAIAVPPRYAFQLLLSSATIKLAWQKFLETPSEDVPIDEQIEAFEMAVDALSLIQPDNVVEEQLVWPVALLLGVFEAAFELFDHDAARPTEKAEFDRVHESTKKIVEGLVEDRHGGMPRFRDLGGSKRLEDQAWLDLVISVALFRTRQYVAQFASS